MLDDDHIDGPNPLVLDVDGTLLKSDMLFECFWSAMGRAPLGTIYAVLSNLSNKPKLKQLLAERGQINLGELPLNLAVVDMAQTAISDGRPVILASGSDIRLVQALAVQQGYEPEVFASDGLINMTATTKAQALVARFGKGGFDYIGDSAADIPVWEVCDKAYIVAPGKAMRAKIVELENTVEEIGEPALSASIVKALRPHQWVKNVLLFLPIIAAHAVGLGALFLTLWGFVVFSAAASSIYIVNDLLDLSADRRHATKRNRPFASGAVRLQTGMAVGGILAVLALGGALMHSWELMAVVAVYMGLSLSYSLVLKEMRWVDVVVLAALYTLRVVVGSIAAGVVMSGWLATFIFPVFLALGCVKRLVELSKASGEGKLPGRGYAKSDRVDLRNIAVTAAVAALTVFGLYTYSSVAQGLYEFLWLLRLAGVAVALWLTRMIMRGWQGRMDYDPIVFALRDPVGVGLMGIGGALILRAAQVG